MSQPQLKSHQLRAERKWDWRKLEALLGRVESRGPKAVSDNELLEAPVL
ncbi:MAG: hypothetical protein QE280_09485 [Caulobacter sp.]|nr:hypothetical protein [Caulobacter sp.]